jgi:hypothetical protein
MERVIVLVDFFIIIIGIFVCYYSIKLVECLNTGFKSGWWIALPLIFMYGLINRVVVFALALHNYLYPNALPDILFDAVAASQIVFWVGALVFVVGLHDAAKKMICPLEK